jgi:hypothetical protein
VPLSDSRAERINATVQDIGDRIKQAVQDIWQDVQKKETFRRIFDNLKTSISFGPTDDSSSVAATGDAVRSGSASVHVVRAGKSHPVRNHSKQPKGSRRIVAVSNDITRDWSLDEDMVRRRIAQRRERRNGFLLHLLFYALAVGGMAASFSAAQPALAEFLVSENVVNDVGGTFLAPLANLEYPLIFALLWGGFIIAHGLNTFYNTGGRLIRRRQSLLNALDAQHGRDWQNTINQREYRRVRRRVNNRYNRRLRFMMHAFTGFMITAAVFAAWPPLRDTLIGMSPQDDFVQMMIDQPMLVPFILALFMSLTVLAHGIFSFIVGIVDNGSREKSYRRELDRERELASLAQPVDVKRKVDDLLLDDEKPKHGLRLNEEGEFTDSLAAELNDDGWQRDTTSRD